MVRSVAHTRPLPMFAVAAFLAATLVLVATAGVRAGTPTCSLLVSSDTNPVPAETITVVVGENGAVTGSGFTPDTEIVIDITVNAAPYAAFPQMTDGAGGFTFGGPVQPDQVGTLVVTATDGQICSDSVTVTVLAAPLPSPSASGLPNSAMSPTGAPMSGASALALAGLGVALVALAAVSIRSRRPA